MFAVRRARLLPDLFLTTAAMAQAEDEYVPREAVTNSRTYTHSAREGEGEGISDGEREVAPFSCARAWEQLDKWLRALFMDFARGTRNLPASSRAPFCPEQQWRRGACSP